MRDGFLTSKPFLQECVKLGLNKQIFSQKLVEEVGKESENELIKSIQVSKKMLLDKMEGENQINVIQKIKKDSFGHSGLNERYNIDVRIQKHDQQKELTEFDIKNLKHFTRDCLKASRQPMLSKRTIFDSSG